MVFWKQLGGFLVLVDFLAGIKASWAVGYVVSVMGAEIEGGAIIE